MHNKDRLGLYLCMVLFTLPSDIDMEEFKLRSKHRDVDRISDSGCAWFTDCQSQVRIDVCFFVTFPGYPLLSLLKNRTQSEFSYTLSNSDFSACVILGKSVWNITGVVANRSQSCTLTANGWFILKNSYDVALFFHKWGFAEHFYSSKSMMTFLT